MVVDENGQLIFEQILSVLLPPPDTQLIQPPSVRAIIQPFRHPYDLVPAEVE
jgi:hypothetical protein